MHFYYDISLHILWLLSFFYKTLAILQLLSCGVYTTALDNYQLIIYLNFYNGQGIIYKSGSTNKLLAQLLQEGA